MHTCVIERCMVLLQVPARQYPVTIHFNRRTELHDYLGAAYRKVILARAASNDATAKLAEQQMA